MKHLTLAGIAIFACVMASAASAPARADEGVGVDSSDFSITPMVVSDYRYRGISRSNRHPAAQIDAAWIHHSGIYAGAWASSVDFAERGPGYIEVAPYAGYKFSVGSNHFDIGAIYYDYPNEEDGEHYQYLEGKLAVARDFQVVNVDASLRASNRYYDNGGRSLYPSVGFAAPIGDTRASVIGSFGHLWVQHPDELERSSYSDWSLGVGIKLAGFKFSAKYVDSSISNGSDCRNLCGAGAVLSLSRKFNFPLN